MVTCVASSMAEKWAVELWSQGIEPTSAHWPRSAGAEQSCRHHNPR